MPTGGLCILRAVARRAADASQAALDVDLARGAGVEIIGDIELFVRERALAPGRAVHRHHRHQRQVDDDGADGAYPQVGRPRHADGRQYRHARS
jgi:hypothetical protein